MAHFKSRSETAAKTGENRRKTLKTVLSGLF